MLQTVKIITAVLGVLALTYGVTVLLGRYAAGRRRKEHMGVLASMHLANNSRLAVVEVGKRMFILGVTEQTITCIDTVEDAEQRALFAAERETEGVTFDTVLQRLRESDAGG